MIESLEHGPQPFRQFANVKQLNVELFVKNGETVIELINVLLTQSFNPFVELHVCTISIHDDDIGSIGPTAVRTIPLLLKICATIDPFEAKANNDPVAEDDVDK